MNDAIERIKRLIAKAEAEIATLTAKIDAMRVVIAELGITPAAEQNALPEPVSHAPPQAPVETVSEIAPRDFANKARRTLMIAKFLEDGPKSQSNICAQLDCSEPTTINLLRLSPFFERDGDSRFAPWQLSQKGRLWLAQQNGKPVYHHVAEAPSMTAERNAG